MLTCFCCFPALLYQDRRHPKQSAVVEWMYDSKIGQFREMRDEIQRNAAEGTVTRWELAWQVNELWLTGRNGFASTMMTLNENVVVRVEVYCVLLLLNLQVFLCLSGMLTIKITYLADSIC